MRTAVAWQPDARASVGFAAAAMLLVMAGFALLFSTTPKLQLSRDTRPSLGQLILAGPVVLPPPRRPRHREPAPIPEIPLLQNVWPPLPPLIAAPRPFTTQDYLDEREKHNAAELRDKVTASALQRELGKTIQKPALSENQSYRTVDGQKILRTGGSCAQIQTVQGSASPTNRIDIAEPITCPGGSRDASNDIGKALDDWAGKVHQSQSPPPS